MLKFRQKINENTRNPSYKSSSNKVYSYSDVTKKNSPIKSTKTVDRSKISKFQLSLRWVVILSIAGILSMLLYASQEPILRIDQNEISINSQSYYQDSITKIIKSSVFNKTKLTFDYLGYEKKVKELIPEVSSVNTSFALVGHRPVVRLKFYKPELYVLSLGKKWIVDSRGVAIAQASSEQIKLPIVTDDIGLPIEVGDSIISSNDVKFILQIVLMAKEKGIQIDKFTTPTIPKQLDVRVVGEQYFTKFNLNDEAVGQIGSWIVARENLAKLNQAPSEYLDVRATEKVFWK